VRGRLHLIWARDDDWCRLRVKLAQFRRVTRLSQDRRRLYQLGAWPRASCTYSVARNIGWRRLISIALLGVLVTQLAQERRDERAGGNPIWLMPQVAK
jgi:hypothetical protein